MSKLPAKLNEFNLFINDEVSYGKVEEITLPKVTIQGEDYRPGGWDGTLEMDRGLEKLLFSAKVSSYFSELMTSLGMMPGKEVRLLARGSISGGQSTNGKIKSIPVECVVSGSYKEFDPGTWSAGGEMHSFDFELVCHYYKLTIGDKQIYEIDVPGMIRKVGGVDQLEEIRNSIMFKA